MTSGRVWKTVCLACHKKVGVYIRGNKYRGACEVLMYNHNDASGKRCPLSGFPGDPVT